MRAQILLNERIRLLSLRRVLGVRRFFYLIFKFYKMDIYEFYRESNRFIELYKSYSHETKQDTKVFITGLNWLMSMQNNAMTYRKYLGSFSFYLSKPTTLQLKKILSEYCNENNLIHFNAFSLIDTVSTKF